jgi:superfamily I DNA/RNA helicase
METQTAKTTETKKVNGFVPSKYQSAIYDFVENGKGNAIIEAYAGCGKTATIVGALSVVPKALKTLFCAFNKKIAKELESKLANKNLSNVTVRTLHSLGFSIMRYNYQSRMVEDKYTTYINDGLRYKRIVPSRRLSNDEYTLYKANIRSLVDLGRVNLATSIEDMNAIVEKFQIMLQNNECEMAMNVIEWGISQYKIMDYTDMIYLPNVMKIKNYPKFDFIFVDECQDLNAAQRELFQKCLAPTGRFVAVGDPYQAIYGFAGADAESFQLIRDIPNTVSLPLSICYRCDSTIIDLAQTLVPGIEARDNAPEGTIDREASYKNIQDGDMVVCRNTAPLVALCMRYISEGTKAFVVGKDIGKNLRNMIRQTRKTEISEVMERLNRQSQKIIDKIVAKSRCSREEAVTHSTYTVYKDKMGAIEVLSQGLETADEVIARINRVFDDENGEGIALSTVHKAKGLESDNVYIICEDKFYNKYAMRLPWMAQQESNIVYVAYTRAKHYLGFVIDFDPDQDQGM